jgi:hypothetical protein
MECRGPRPHRENRTRNVPSFCRFDGAQKEILVVVVDQERIDIFAIHSRGSIRVFVDLVGSGHDQAQRTSHGGQRDDGDHAGGRAVRAGSDTGGNPDISSVVLNRWFFDRCPAEIFVLGPATPAVIQTYSTPETVSSLSESSEMLWKYVEFSQRFSTRRLANKWRDKPSV